MPSQAEWDDVNAKLSFKCVHEAVYLPPLAPEPDSVFKYGRYLQTQVAPKNFENIGRYYRIAAAHGHYKANNNLQLMLTGGFLESPARQKEVIALTENSSLKVYLWGITLWVNMLNVAMVSSET